VNDTIWLLSDRQMGNQCWLETPSSIMLFVLELLEYWCAYIVSEISGATNLRELSVRRIRWI